MSNNFNSKYFTRKRLGGVCVYNSDTNEYIATISYNTKREQIESIVESCKGVVESTSIGLMRDILELMYKENAHYLYHLHQFALYVEFINNDRCMLRIKHTIVTYDKGDTKIHLPLNKVLFDEYINDIAIKDILSLDVDDILKIEAINIVRACTVVIDGELVFDYFELKGKGFRYLL